MEAFLERNLSLQRTTSSHEAKAKISSPGNPFLYPGGRKAAGGVIGGAASQQGTTSGCIAYPGGSSSTFCCFSHRLRRRPPGVNVFTAARKPTPLISSFWDFVFARSTRRSSSDIICIRSITSSIRFTAVESRT